MNNSQEVAGGESRDYKLVVRGGSVPFFSVKLVSAGCFGTLQMFL